MRSTQCQTKGDPVENVLLDREPVENVLHVIIDVAVDCIRELNCYAADRDTYAKKKKSCSQGSTLTPFTLTSKLSFSALLGSRVLQIWDFEGVLYKSL